MDIYSEEYLLNINLYEYLGCDRAASIHAIRKLFRKLALTCHPDKHPNDPNAAESFKFLNAVVEFLTDKDKRACYDIHWEAKLREERQRQRQEQSYGQFYQGSYDQFNGANFTNGTGFFSGASTSYWEYAGRRSSEPVYEEFQSKHGRPNFGGGISRTIYGRKICVIIISPLVEKALVLLASSSFQSMLCLFIFVNSCISFHFCNFI
ncbi:hypothetical protein JTE90_020654 [Oedothorax gibbosus]|uniref:J domain-containing protein n=1 Tax=Oedothorax gibbosus TaxID=931172 RepID=A0AAV6UTV5_9ARAC|nr:hypothetical protein JTE90_020654 [Oedothorax gibbosus]